MGFLIVRVVEGKNLEAKDHSGLSDPFVSLKVVHNESQNTVSKAKSKVVKKNLNPQWNETLTLPMPNIPKGHSLVIQAYDWNRIGTKQPLGDYIISLDDYKPAIEKALWVNLQNAASGSLHLGVTHKVDNKSKILVCYGSDPLIDYELLREVKLSTQMDVLCQLAKAIGSQESYALQIKDSEVIITQENLQDPKFDIPDGTFVKLILRPNLQVQAALESLRNETTQKKAIFDLKNQLQDSAFAQAFIAKDGISAITAMVLSASGNMLAYALSALDTCMNYGFGWDNLSPQVIEKLVSFLSSTNLNVSRSAFKIAVHLAGSKNHGYPLLSASIKKDPTCYSKIVNNLSGGNGSDVLIQSTTVEFLTKLLISAPLEDKDSIAEALENNNLTFRLKELLSTSDAELKGKINHFLKVKYSLDNEPEPYNKENKTHEKMLLELWSLIFPDRKLESRVSEQWKAMGFQGTDPATDFRGMGILALRHLLYFGRYNTEIIRGLMEAQEDNNENYYPVATACINVSKLLFDIFRQEEGGHLKYMNFLFDHPFALEETYCIVLQFFDKLWDEMEATYMNFSQVITSVNEYVVENLDKSKSINDFKDKLFAVQITTTLNGPPSTPAQMKQGQPPKPTKGKKKEKKTTPFFMKIFTDKPGASTKKVPPGTIHEAVKSGDTRKVTELLNEGVSVNELNEQNLTPLQIAVMSGNLDMTRLLLWKDADADPKTDSGWTPLHEAAKAGSLEMCDILLHKGANPNAETNDGVLALHYLVSRKVEEAEKQLQHDILNEMLNRGVDINHKKNHNEETPLHYAVSKGLIDTVKFLLEHNADINCKNKRGYTPLHMAVILGLKDIVAALLEFNPDLTVTCKEGSVQELAKSNKEIADLFDTSKKAPATPTKGGVGAKRVLPAVPPRSPASPSAVAVGLEGYHDNLTREQAEQYVSSFGSSCLLLRSSSVRGCVAMTVFNAADSEVIHYLIVPRSAGGFSIQDSEDTTTYPTLNDLLNKSPLLKGLARVPTSYKPKNAPATPNTTGQQSHYYNKADNSQPNQPATTQEKPAEKTTTPPAGPGNPLPRIPPKTASSNSLKPSNAQLKSQLEELQRMISATIISLNDPEKLNKAKTDLKAQLANLSNTL